MRSRMLEAKRKERERRAQRERETKRKGKLFKQETIQFCSSGNECIIWYIAHGKQILLKTLPIYKSLYTALFVTIFFKRVLSPYTQRNLSLHIPSAHTTIKTTTVSNTSTMQSITNSTMIPTTYQTNQRHYSHHHYHVLMYQSRLWTKCVVIPENLFMGTISWTHVKCQTVLIFTFYNLLGTPQTDDVILEIASLWSFAVW